MREVVKQWCKENDIWVEYSCEDAELGHCGAIINSLNFVDGNSIYAVVNGDTYHNLNLNAIRKVFSEDKKAIAMKVISKNILTNKLDGCGVYMFKKKCSKYFRKGVHTDEILKCIPTMQFIASDNFYLDIGSHKGLKKAKESKILLEVK